MKRGFSFLGLCFLTLSPLEAHVTLSKLFADHMVLQREMEIPVWGTADPREHVVVNFNDQKVETDADDQGQWKVKLPAMTAGGPYPLTAQGSDTVTVNDVLIGEVWLCSGQSNMEFGVGAVLNHPQEVANANFSQIRLCTIPHTVKDQPATDVDASWAICAPDSVPKFSGVAYFMGRELFQKLNVPIGLIQDTWSGTNIEGWMSSEALASDPDFRPLQDRWAKKLADYPQAKADYDAKYPDAAKAAQLPPGSVPPAPVPNQPQPPQGPGSRFTPAGLYNGQIFPVAPFAIRGIAWYQGENNLSWAFLYRKELTAMIKDWRQLWGEGDMPFIVIQLPSCQPVPPSSSPQWAEMRESQAKALDLPNTGLVVTIDLGDPDHPENLHPRNKQDVGHRLALVMEKMVYGQDVVASGPVFKTATVSDNSVRVEFDNADGLKTKNGPVTGFELSGSDQKYMPATGTIDGTAVVLQADAVPSPKTVRYDWANDPKGNLYNGADLPARPFRTDDFPLATQNSK